MNKCKQHGMQLQLKNVYFLQLYFTKITFNFRKSGNNWHKNGQLYAINWLWHFRCIFAIFCLSSSIIIHRYEYNSNGIPLFFAVKLKILDQTSESATKPPPFPAFGVGALELPKKDIVKAAKMPQIAPPADDGVDDEDEGEPIIFNGAKEVDLTPDEIPEPPQYDDYVEEDPNNPGQMEQQYYVDENGSCYCS